MNESFRTPHRERLSGLPHGVENFCWLGCDVTAERVASD
jgi:hypothetical protein